MKQEVQEKMHEASEVNTSGTRDYALDNIRFFLIFCVVFGHLLVRGEKTEASNMLYEIIYSFHMPAFLFLFGYNIRFSARRIILGFFVPYFVFQTLYIVYEHCILHNDVILQYTTAHWILWYLLACIYYQLMLQIYDIERKKNQVLIVFFSFMISLLIGFEKTIGDYMSLSRFFVFQPFFVLGFYCKKNDILKKITAHKKIYSIILRIGLYGVLLSLIYLRIDNMPYELLYGIVPYNGYNITIG